MNELLTNTREVSLKNYLDNQFCDALKIYFIVKKDQKREYINNAFIAERELYYLCTLKTNK